MKKYIVVTLLTLIFILSSCSNKDEEIIIGFIGTLTGQYAEVGINTMYGVQMAVDEINDSGGVDGKKIKLLIRDDEANSNVAVQMQNELKQLGCNVIIGHSLSIVAVDAVDNASNNDILLISPSIGTDLLTGIDDNLIRIVTTVYYEATVISEHMFEQSPDKVMLIINEDNLVLTQYHLNSFFNFFTNEGYSEDDIIISKFFSNNEEEIGAIKNTILLESPDAIMIASSNTDAAPFVNYIKGLDLDVSIHLSSWAGTSILNRIDSVDTDGIYIYNDFVTGENDENYLRYKTSYEELYGQEPDMLSTNGYDAVNIIYRALIEGTEYTAEAMKDTILTYSSYNGINDSYGIDEFGDNFRDVIQYKIVNGELQPTE